VITKIQGSFVYSRTDCLGALYLRIDGKEPFSYINTGPFCISTSEDFFVHV